MDKPDVIELTEVRVDGIGLVKRPAGRTKYGQPSLFYFIKSENGGMSMSDNQDERAQALALLEIDEADLEAFNEWRADQEVEDELPDEYTERLEAMKDEFTAKLEAESERAEKLAEAFAESERARRLAQFTDRASQFSFGVEVEQFAEDLMAVADLQPEVYERMIQVFNGLDEQIRQSALFDQFSVATAGSDTSPFETEVEKVRSERFSDDDYDTGWAKAMKVVSEEKPELARQYVREGN